MYDIEQYEHLPLLGVTLKYNCTLSIMACTKPADPQQICFTNNRLTADYFVVCKVCFQSVADTTAFIISKDVFLQMRNK